MIKKEKKILVHFRTDLKLSSMLCYHAHEHNAIKKLHKRVLNIKINTIMSCFN